MCSFQLSCWKERPKSSPEIILVHITRAKCTKILLLSFVFQLNTVISLSAIFCIVLQFLCPIESIDLCIIAFLRVLFINELAEPVFSSVGHVCPKLYQRSDCYEGGWVSGLTKNVLCFVNHLTPYGFQQTEDTKPCFYVNSCSHYTELHQDEGRLFKGDQVMLTLIFSELYIF